MPTLLSRLVDVFHGYGFIRTCLIGAYELAYGYRFGFGTLRFAELDKFDLPADVRKHARAYLPSPYYLTAKAFRSLGLNLARRTFVDFGCGRGRVLLFAADFPFSRVVGVEASPQLAEEARNNIARLISRAEISGPEFDVLTADAATAPIPSENAILYFGDPFGPDVLEPLARRIAATGPGRRITVIYVNPAHEDVFLRAGMREIAALRLSPGRGFIVYEP